MSEVFYAVYDFADVNNVVDTTYHDASVIEVKTARVAKVVAESVDEVRNVVVGVLAPSSHVTVIPESNFVIEVDEPAGFPTVTPEGETADVAETPLTADEQRAAGTDPEDAATAVDSEPADTASPDNPATADGTGESTTDAARADDDGFAQPVRSGDTVTVEKDASEK